jgi:hypothetical protein
VIVLTRLRTDPATRAHAQRRRAEGKTNREIRRRLVRYVARQLYRLLEAPPPLDPQRSVRENDQQYKLGEVQRGAEGVHERVSWQVHARRVGRRQGGV